MKLMDIGAGSPVAPPALVDSEGILLDADPENPVILPPLGPAQTVEIAWYVAALGAATAADLRVDQGGTGARIHVRDRLVATVFGPFDALQVCLSPY